LRLGITRFYSTCAASLAGSPCTLLRHIHWRCRFRLIASRFVFLSRAAWRTAIGATTNGHHR
ncbi:hypothetical protein PFISCL1PPCAC_701, partial [Pristionchus fissidentatus]